jgi:hypothetical protein
MSEVYEIHSEGIRRVDNLRAWLRENAIDQASFKEYVTRLSDDTVLCSTHYTSKETVSVWNRLHSDQEDPRDEYYRREFGAMMFGQGK